MAKKSLKERYEAVCNEYVSKFCKKQGLEFEYWVANQVGGITQCNDFFFNFSDIVWDINSKQPKGLIIKWYDESASAPVDNVINYFSYTKGLRFSDL